MKRLLLAGALLATAALAAWSTVARGQTEDVRVTCKSRGIDVYFWPHGHPNVKAYKFPKYGPPHLEVYRRGSFASKSFFIFVSATNYNYANSCELATNPLPTRWGGGPKATIKVTRRVRCFFPTIAQLKIVPLGTSGGLRVLRGASANELLQARIKARGSTLTYDKRYCRTTPVPGVR